MVASVRAHEPRQGARPQPLALCAPPPSSPLLQDPVPPDDPYVQVRVLKSYGEVLFASGKVSLQRGKSHWLPRDEAHPLVMEGVLEFVASGGQ